MRVEQYLYPEGVLERSGKLDAGLVLVFGATARIREPGLTGRIRAMYPNALILGCSTAGEIMGTRVYDDTLVITAAAFDSTTLRGSAVKVSGIDESYDAGRRIALALNREGLRHVFVLCEGLNINGTELVSGLKDHLMRGVTITGGLSGDGDRFRETYAFLDGEPATNTVAAVGFSGSQIKVGFGSFGGWDPFGPERLITRSRGNILFELDGKSALALYKQYLGEHAAGLPATGLLFPLSLRVREGSNPVVRTLLAVNEADQSMTFAGTMPEGTYARLMKANFERLIDGAVDAARTSSETLGNHQPELVILISCVGRKLILKQRIEEEVEGVCEILGGQAVYTGFYSYGEISPFSRGEKCELHNQTMTITAIHEE